MGFFSVIKGRQDIHFPQVELLNSRTTGREKNRSSVALITLN